VGSCLVSVEVARAGTSVLADVDGATDSVSWYSLDDVESVSLVERSDWKSDLVDMLNFDKIDSVIGSCIEGCV
jgi:hypothetical protein